MLALEIALLSDRGGREYNEDAGGQWQSQQHLCCVVADGAGGHGGGDIASNLVVQELMRRFSQQPSQGAQDLAAMLRATNEVLISERVPGTAREDMHSTVVCLVVDCIARRAHWAHSGDSRLYGFRGGRLRERTRDHSLVQALVDNGLIEPGQARKHPKRSELHSALGQAPELLQVSAGESQDELESGDAFLLCSDGLWEYLDDPELESTLAAAPNPGAWIADLAARVRAAASHKASHDNFSALAVWARSAPQS